MRKEGALTTKNQITPTFLLIKKRNKYQEDTMYFAFVEQEGGIEIRGSYIYNILFFLHLFVFDA